MKKSEVTVGSVYRVKVSGNLVDVRITGENPRGGWDGVNMSTRRNVRIHSAHRLRAVAQPRPSRRRKIVSLAEYEAEAGTGTNTGTEAADGRATREHMRAVHAADQQNARPAEERAAAPDGQTASKRAMAKSAPAAKAGGEKRLSAINAAVKILAERDPADGPLTCAQMIERMAAKGYWTPARGLTPANTLYTAVTMLGNWAA